MQKYNLSDLALQQLEALRQMRRIGVSVQRERAALNYAEKDAGEASK